MLSLATAVLIAFIAWVNTGALWNSVSPLLSSESDEIIINPEPFAPAQRHQTMSEKKKRQLNDPSSSYPTPLKVLRICDLVKRSKTTARHQRHAKSKHRPADRPTALHSTPGKRFCRDSTTITGPDSMSALASSSEGSSEDGPAHGEADDGDDEHRESNDASIASSPRRKRKKSSTVDDADENSTLLIQQLPPEMTLAPLADDEDRSGDAPYATMAIEQDNPANLLPIMMMNSTPSIAHVSLNVTSTGCVTHTITAS